MALVRVAIYGCGQFANRTHIPNLMKSDDVEIVAICDSNAKQLKSTAEAFNISQTYQDGHELLDNEEIDVLYSIVPAYTRTNIEATAAAKGIHIFSEKPQALTMAVANRIDSAIRQSGVISTVDHHHIKHHYYCSHESINPTRIVPVGPHIDFTTPHDRDRIRKAVMSA